MLTLHQAGQGVDKHLRSPSALQVGADICLGDVVLSPGCPLEAEGLQQGERQEKRGKTEL